MSTQILWPPPSANLQQLLEAAERQFIRAGLYFGHGTDNPWDEAVWLASYALGLAPDQNAACLQQPVAGTDYHKLIALFERRINERLPAAYITGKAWFAGLEFTVNEDVLVPRSPLAELIEAGFAPWLLTEPQHILDLCTGSGCIGIATALAFPDATVDLSDLSRAALEVAEHNVHAHGVQGRVRIIEGDLFAGLTGQCYDLILCNPPYVDADDLAAMPAEYQAEPAMALASGSDGLDFTRRLLREAPDYLADRGLLVVEVGNSWPALEQAFPQVPFMWLEFVHGGHGVLVMTAEELVQYRPLFGG